ncbi:MAG TPA: ribonucleotide-diphosphate reductase subunit beta [Gemmatimonadaceae bacterium]|nr:ribonucleotide-diphosphate reductase subunit beta [Gemmatimonadaceae bacterium]
MATTTPLRTDTKYFQLYATAKRLAWDPATVDLSRDRAQWRAIVRDHARERYAEQILHLCALFFAGEESVTRTLSPFLAAIARAGLGVDKEMFLTSQLFEEAKHFEFFARYFAEVFEEDGTAVAARHLGGAPGAVLVDDLDAVADRLRHEEDPAALRALLVEGVVHYMGVVEAMLARTGYAGSGEALAARGWLPGLQEGFRLVRRDEGRHVAFGINFVAELTRDDPALRDVVHATFERHLPNVLGTVQSFAVYEHPLVDLERLQQFSLDAFAQFVAAAGLTDGGGHDDLAREIGDATTTLDDAAR